MKGKVIEEEPNKARIEQPDEEKVQNETEGHQENSGDTDREKISKENKDTDEGLQKVDIYDNILTFECFINKKKTIKVMSQVLSKSKVMGKESLWIDRQVIVILFQGSRRACWKTCQLSGI